MKIAVIGLGHVGRNLRARFHERGVEKVVGYDVASCLPYPREEIAECEFAVICVGTPEAEDGSADLTHVTAAIAALPEGVPVMLRSTVTPGTTTRLSVMTNREVVFSPEYVGETKFARPLGGWPDDDLFQILGGPPHLTAWFASRLSAIFGPEPRYLRMGAIEAEIVKYMENCWFAVKISFANEFAEYCREVGAEWEDVREGWLADPRVERDHSQVFADAPGYSGRCLPKDVASMLAAAASAGVTLPVLEAADRANDERLARRARQA